MWCDIEPEELSAFIDGEVTADRAAAVAEHVSACAGCRAQLERARQADDAIRSGGAEPGLIPIRADLLRRAAAIRTRSRVRVGLAAASVAAVVLIGFQFADWDRRAAGPPAVPPRSEPNVPAIESLELDAASLRLVLVAEKPDPTVRRGFDARLDAIVDRIEKLRSN